ncbi:MAG: bestrophin family ion channel, partial [Planctomycetota bacterium]
PELLAQAAYGGLKPTSASRLRGTNKPSSQVHHFWRTVVCKTAAKYQRNFGIGLVKEEVGKIDFANYLSEEELAGLQGVSNRATHLLDNQAQDLRLLRSKGLIDDFRHIALQNILGEFFTHQGKAERIKNFPLPRQYANSSSIFVALFVFLLPFGMVTEFSEIGTMQIWWAIPFAALVGWVFVMMEVVGDYSENPFQGMANDVPMLTLSRTIEIDLLELLGEENIPSPVSPVDGILM